MLAEAGKIGTIIVKDMSRFGRNYLEVGFYTEILFPKKQIRFVAINNSVDSDKPQDNDFTPFLNIMNEWYAKDTSNKIKSIFLSRMSDGKRCSGSIPYGYNRLPEDKQTLVVDPVVSQVVKHIFELAAEGLTLCGEWACRLTLSIAVSGSMNRNTALPSQPLLDSSLRRTETPPELSEGAH